MASARFSKSRINNRAPSGAQIPKVTKGSGLYEEDLSKATLYRNYTYSLRNNNRRPGKTGTIADSREQTGTMRVWRNGKTPSAAIGNALESRVQIPPLAPKAFRLSQPTVTCGALARNMIKPMAAGKDRQLCTTEGGNTRIAWRPSMYCRPPPAYAACARRSTTQRSHTTGTAYTIKIDSGESIRGSPPGRMPWLIARMIPKQSGRKYLHGEGS